MACLMPSLGWWPNSFRTQWLTLGVTMGAEKQQSCLLLFSYVNYTVCSYLLLVTYYTHSLVWKCQLSEIQPFLLSLYSNRSSSSLSGRSACLSYLCKCLYIYKFHTVSHQRPIVTATRGPIPQFLALYVWTAHRVGTVAIKLCWRQNLAPLWTTSYNAAIDTAWTKAHTDWKDQCQLLIHLLSQ